MPRHIPSALHEHVAARAGNIAPMRRKVVGFAADCGASQSQCDNVALAVNEALTNAVLHAYAGREVPGDMTVDASGDERSLDVLVSDDGVGMIPRAEKSPGLGLGVQLMARVSDQLCIANGSQTSPGLRVRLTFVIG
ncbi:MAG TPA: ATP-binding protein [Solirubrobacteraceae bacterium]|nr:ATP-binding protein [Solirubrobacteraceae bacterium]